MKKKAKRKIGSAHASVKKEMAKPRTARSARIAQLNLDTTRNPEQPSTTMPGTVDKIIPPRSSQPEKAQITVDVTDHWHRDLRIENMLTDEHGDDVKLKKGAHVEVTVTKEPPPLNSSRLDAGVPNTQTFSGIRLLGRDTSIRSVRRWLISRSEGNQERVR